METAPTTAALPALSPTPISPRYADLEGWRAYETFFPPALRCTPETTPTESYWRWNGLDVHLDRAQVPESPIKIIVLHGAGAYGRVMAPAAVLARRHGFETVAPDLPGYGLTRIAPEKMTYPLWIDCVADLIDAELRRDDRPVVLFGVSLGGVLAYHAAARSKRVAGVVVTTLADPREPAVRRGFARNALLGSAGLWLLQKLRRLTDGLPLPMRFMSRMNRISNNPALAQVCSTDRLGGGNWVPARFLRTFVETSPDVEPENFTTCPVLLAHPGVDHMTDIALSRRFFDRLAAPKKMVVLEGASHMPTEHPGIDQLETEVLAFLRERAREARRS